MNLTRPMLSALLLAGLTLPVHSQAPSTVATANGWSYQVLARPASAVGLLILFPGYGGDAGEFKGDSGVAVRMAVRRIATVVVVPPKPTLYFDSASVHGLAVAVGEVARSMRLPPGVTVLGGTSVGGTAAIQLAELCAKGNCPLGGKVAGAFAVDAPLDFERIWRGESLTIQRAAPQSNLAESKMLLDEIRRVLGGTPTTAAAAYHHLSPFAAFAPNGGRAELLRSTPLRAYTEPDIGWWLENRALDYYALNAIDAAALINQLRQLGNRRAELIVSSGKGYRPDGTRHPHSWSIVDTGELAAWVGQLVGEGAKRSG